MGKLVDLTGMKFGELTVLSKKEGFDPVGAKWNCLCDCGNHTTVNSLKLRTGHTKSCGCLRTKTKSTLTHGLSNKSRTYRSWKEMRQRCTNKNSGKWKWYGGRGITFCDRWNSYELFLADMGERPDGKTLDRIDSDGNYEPSNCRWASAKQQAESNRGVFKKGIIPANKTPTEVVLRMCEMRDAGIKNKDIAAYFGKHESVVCTLVKNVKINGASR